MALLLVLAVGERAGAMTPAATADRDRDRSTACEDEGRSVEEHEVIVAPEPVRVILPCSLAEHAFVVPSGDPSCADATIYVVTDAGVLLCQIDVAALASSTTLTIEQAPSATFSSSTAFSAAGIPSFASTLMPPLVVDLAGPLPAAWALPRDGHAHPPAVPS